jgi:hypothetical protein
MEPEGVVNALRRIHEVVKAGGALMDLHPTRPFASVEAGGRQLGSLDEAEFMELVSETEAGLEQAVTLGLFARQKALRFEVVERFDDGEELLRKIDEDWFGTFVPPELADAVRAEQPPFDLRERVVLQRLRVV